MIVKDEVLSAVNHFVAYITQMGRLKDDPVSLIRDWHLSDDEQISVWLTGIKKNIDDGKYSTYIFPTIIKTVSMLEEYEICGDLGRQVIDSMKQHIVNASHDDIEALGREQFYLQGRAAEIYQKYKSEISEAIDKALQISEEKQWRSLIEDKNNWASNLLSFIRTRSGAKHSFVYWIAPKDLYSIALESSNEQLYTFRQALAEACAPGIYFPNSEKDYLNLGELVRLFEKTDKTSISKTKGAHLDWLVGDMRKYLERMRPLLSSREGVARIKHEE